MKTPRTLLTSKAFEVGCALAAVAISLLGAAVLYFNEFLRFSGEIPAWSWSYVDVIEGGTAALALPFAIAARLRAKDLGRPLHHPGAALVCCIAAVTFDGGFAAAGAVHEHIIVPMHEVSTRHSLPEPTTISGFIIPAGAEISEDRDGTRIRLKGGKLRGGDVDAPFVIGREPVVSVDLARDTSFDGVACLGGDGAFATLGAPPNGDVSCKSSGQRIDGVTCARGFDIRRELGKPGVECRLAAPYLAEGILWPAGTGVDTTYHSDDGVRFVAILRTAPVPLRLEGKPVPPMTEIAYGERLIAFGGRSLLGDEADVPGGLTVDGCHSGNVTVHPSTQEALDRNDGTPPPGAAPVPLPRVTPCSSTYAIELGPDALTFDGGPYPRQWAPER